jgi:hypothetical protein
MAEARNVYGEVHSKADLKRIFSDIRKDVEAADTRPALTELYKRAGYLNTLTFSPSWEERFGKDAAALRETGKDEFRKTAHSINRQAAAIGTEAVYDETWGEGR